MTQIENADIVFSFNKGSINNPEIPPWVLKCKGNSCYVWHVTAKTHWSTKETPDSPHTKGSIKFKNATLLIDEEQNAIIT